MAESDLRGTTGGLPEGMGLVNFGGDVGKCRRL